MVADRFMETGGKRSAASQLIAYLKERLGTRRELTLVDFDVEKICDVFEALQREVDETSDAYEAMSEFEHDRIQAEEELEEAEKEIDRLESEVRELEDEIQKLKAAKK